MKRTRLIAVAGLLLAALQAQAQTSIAPGGIYTQDFDALGSSSATWIDNFTLPGWYAAVSNNVTDGTVAPYTTAYTATSGGSSGSSTVLYAFGSGGSSERALGGQPVTTRHGLLAWQMQNTSVSVITNLVVTYDGEQWRQNGTANSFISVSYKIFPVDSGSIYSLDGWTDAPASLTFTAPTSGDTGALDGNESTNRVAGLTASFPGINLQPNEEIWFKWTLIKISGGNIQIGIDNVTVAVPLGTPPVIGTIPNITVVAGQNSETNSFTVNDLEDDAASTPLPTPVATSANESVISAANVFVGGTGANRTVYVVAGESTGTADITLSVTDSDGNIGQQTFTVTVVPSNLPPLISAIPPAHTFLNTPAVVPFTVEDPESPASSLTLTGWVADYSGTILQSISLETDADGTNGTATITPVADIDGVGVVTISVSDTNEHTTTVSFTVMVLPAANAVLSEHFDYPLNTSIINSSPGFWTRRNSSAQSLNFRTSASDAQAWIRPKSAADDASVPLVNGPYQPGSGTVLFTMFKAQWIDVGDVPPVGDSSGAFILVAPNPTATADQLMQVATRTNGVPEGFFRLLISNGTGAYEEYSFTDLSLWIPYNIVVRYDVDTAQSTLWIDAASETFPSVSATDGQSPAQVSHVSIRQEPDMGNIYLDDLKVIAIQKPVFTTITAPVGGNVDVYFTAGAGDTIADFELERAASVTGPFGTVTATFSAEGNNTFKAIAPASGDQGFYRVKRKPLTF